jgi:hypothetical protein
MAVQVSIYDDPTRHLPRLWRALGVFTRVLRNRRPVRYIEADRRDRMAWASEYGIG